ncbi:hypothetical protein [Bacillus thuringiensis]|uniref:hypothetical protein n=1 Tax=Bacillus thuringiensis TaxID=1428 RepID=UPI00366AC614
MKLDKIESAETKKKMPLGRKIAIGAIGILFSMNIIQNLDRKNLKKEIKEWEDKWKLAEEVYQEAHDENVSLKSELKTLKASNESEPEEGKTEEVEQVDGRLKELKESQYEAREQKAHKGLNALGSESAQAEYKKLIKSKLERWASKDMLSVAQEGTNFREIDDNHLPWTDATEPNGPNTKHIYRNGYDQLEITYNLDGIITKSEWKTGVNK